MTAPHALPTSSPRRWTLATRLMLVTTIALGLGLTGCGWWGQHRDPVALRWIEHRLDLTAVQKEKLEAVRVELRRTRDDIRESREDRRDHLATILGAESLDQQALLGDLRFREEELDHSLPALVAKFAEFHASLTPEQRQQLVQGLREHHL